MARAPNTEAILEEQKFEVDISRRRRWTTVATGDPTSGAIQRGRSYSAPAPPPLPAEYRRFRGRRAWARPDPASALGASVGGVAAPLAVASRLRLLERLRLTPEGYTLAEMMRLTRALLAAGQRVFVLSFHSPSVVPGNTPYVTSEADLDAFLERLRGSLTRFRGELNGRFVTPGALKAELEQLALEEGTNESGGPQSAIDLEIRRLACAISARTRSTARARSSGGSRPRRLERRAERHREPRAYRRRWISERSRAYLAIRSRYSSSASGRDGRAGRPRAPARRWPSALRSRSAAPLLGQREDGERLAQPGHLDHHRDAVAGDDEAVGEPEQRMVGVVAAAIPAVEAGAGRQLGLERLDHRRRRPSAGRDVQRAALGRRDRAALVDQARVATAASNRYGLVGPPTRSAASGRGKSAKRARHASAAAAIAASSTRISGRSRRSTLGRRGSWNCGGAITRSKRSSQRLGRPITTSLAACACCLDPQRGHRRAPADGQDQIGPGRLERIAERARSTW